MARSFSVLFFCCCFIFTSSVKFIPNDSLGNQQLDLNYSSSFTFATFSMPFKNFHLKRIFKPSTRSAISPAVKFYLYSAQRYHQGNSHIHGRHSKSSGRILNEELFTGDYKRLKRSNYNPKLPLVIIMHGFLSNATWANGEVDTIRRAYLDTKFHGNIMAADYGRLVAPAGPRIRGVSSLYYPQAIANIPTIGNSIVEFLLFLMRHGFISEWNEVHLIGFSLGSHVAGYIGHKIYKKSGSKVGRITGLDPAGFLFYLRDKNGMLDSSDANFVDITHTAQGFYGFSGVLGHVDYFVNGGGPKQPGCVQLTRPLTYIDSCSHTLAYEYYAESIRNPYILACPCSSCSGKSQQLRRHCLYPASYGEYVDPRVRGTFAVQIQPKRKKRRRN